MNRFALAFLLSTICTFSNAGIINSMDVAGYTTFQDTNTGRVWLDMDNFFNSASTSGTSGFNMITAAQNAGFTFATRNDVAGLLNTLPLTNGEWASYAPIMGYGIPRDLIWGMYDDGNGNPFGWAWAFSNDNSWNYNDNATNANVVQNSGSSGAVDMGIWAYSDDITLVPEPSTLTLLGIGLLATLYTRRRKSLRH